MQCHIERYLDGAWRAAAVFEPREDGIVADVVGKIAQEDLIGALATLADRVATLPQVLEECGVEPEVQTRCLPRIEAVLRGLMGVP